MAFTGQLSTRRKTSTTSLPRASSSILSSSIANLVQNAPSRNTLIQFLSLSLSLPFFFTSFSKTARGWRGEQRMNMCISIWGERKGKKCHEAVIKNDGFQGNSRTLRDPPSPPPAPPLPRLKSLVVVVKNISWPRRHPSYERA